ncbi:zinc finger MYM-type protein 1-like isoform X2 [Aphis gossypii]|uniref:zinc finger MYM-type protein 1-like isoform X2 n=1 Tax=Aphis gossypii TaxID=80765 RepID=UPI0021599855|nr:zinc finger MYM-type protein 1-like isoform X2 [Aphis gossypii]
MNIDLHESNKFTNDPDLIPQYVSSTLLSYLVDLGPCKPLPSELINNIFPVKTDSMGRSRSFHESYYYYKETANQLPTKRLWLSYSPSSDKIYCYSCKLFGLAKAKKSIMVNGSNDWTNLNRNIKNHECSTEHLESEISRGLYQKNYRIDLHIMENANKNIAENREVLRVIIEIIIFSARQNIALRGHDEKLTSNNRGNFLELIELLSHHNAVLKIHLDKLKKKKQNRLTFLSQISQNKILKILGELVRCSILTKIKKAGLLSVIIDTTTDVANIEQFSFIIRFVNMHGDMEERLVALEAAADETGKGLFKKFCEITEKHNIDWKKNLCAQAYDGAAAMQGTYSGLRTFIQRENSKAIYVWCFAHLLNLVVVDTYDSCSDTKNFFGHLQSVIEFMRARKRTTVFIECQHDLYPEERVRRIKSFSNTRWTSHDRVINVVYERFKALLKCLIILESFNDRVTSSNASIIKSICSTFTFVVTLIFMKNVFSITTPLSNYLQSKSLDFIEALRLVNNAKENLLSMRSDIKYKKIIDEAKQFCETHDLPEKDFKIIRLKKRKRQIDENIKEVNLNSLYENYKISTYFMALDKIITSFTSRFSEWIDGICLENLKNEYKVFSTSVTSLHDGIKLPDNIHKASIIDDKTMELNSDTLEISESEIDHDETESTCYKNTITVSSILHVLTSFDLVSAFPNLYLVYKALGTLPASSASAERSFSKVKLVKTRLTWSRATAV